MFRFFPHLAVTRPVLTTMLVSVFVVLGVFTLLTLRVELFPEIEFPVVTVATVYPGAGPEEVESEVTDPLEEALASLAGLDEMLSFSQDDLSVIVVVFDLEMDVEQAGIDVRDEIEGVRAALPAGAEPPTVQRFDFTALPIMSLALAGPQGADALYDVADDRIRDRLSRVPGVARVDIVGGRPREIDVLVRPERLTAHGLTLGAVVERIRSENVRVPGGRLRDEREDTPVRVVGEYRSLDELEALRLFPPAGGTVGLDELAVVRDGRARPEQFAALDGEPAVSLSITQVSGANTLETARGVYAELERIRREILPPGAVIEIVRDQSDFIQASVTDVLLNMLIGILLTAVVLFFFLHSWRTTLIAALAMPATIISAFVLMGLFGFTLNVMTLMALGITVGILVANTIVVVENISRHSERGEDAARSAEEGTSEIAVAVTAATLTNIVVFTPIAFMTGIIGQFFYAFGLTVVFATVFSIFISFTLAPLLAGRLLRQRPDKESSGPLARLFRRWDSGYARLERRYGAVLGWAVGRPRNGWVVIGSIVAAALVLLVGSAGFLQADFIPTGDEGAAQVTLELPPGSSLERTTELVLEADRRIRTFEGVRSTLATIAGGGEMMIGGGGVNVAEILVTFQPDASTAVCVAMLRRLLADLPDTRVTVIATDPAGQVGPPGAPIQVDVAGPDYEVLQALATEIEEAMRGLEELADVVNTLDEPRPELAFVPDRRALADHGLSAAQVGAVVRSSVEGTPAGVYRGEVGREIDIRVLLVEEARRRPEHLEVLDVATPAGAVPLSMLGRWEEALAPASIQRVDRQRSIRLEAQLGVADIAQAVAAIESAMEDVDVPPEYGWSVGGEFELFEEALGSIVIALLMAIVLTYIVLAMILESFIHPFTIMLTLPLGAAGASLGLFLTGQSLNIFSMMAMVMLVGIVVNNAILILDYTAQLRRAGRGIADALLVAAPARLRPIIMANVAIVAALLPQALSTGEGAVFRVPMAVVTIGGVLLAAILTLLLIPVIYTKMDRLTVMGRREG